MVLRLVIRLTFALGTTAVAAFVTMCIGAYVSSSGAGLACLSIPGCAGNVVVYTAGQFVQMLHRVRRWRNPDLRCRAGARVGARRRRAFAPRRLLGAALVALQVLLGLLNVALRLPTDLREAHAVNAALLFLAFFIATVFAMLDVAPRAATRPFVEACRAMMRLLRDYYELSKPRIIVLLLDHDRSVDGDGRARLRRLPLLGWTLLARRARGGIGRRVQLRLGRRHRSRYEAHASAARFRRGESRRARRDDLRTSSARSAFVSIFLSYSSIRSRRGSRWPGNVYYVVIYTMWLKRITPLNIVIGGAAGSVPPLVGWAAVTQTIGAPALGLFALIFLWTPPHFWSLALMTETEYDKAKIPMFPNVYGRERTKREIVYYSRAAGRGVARCSTRCT